MRREAAPPLDSTLARLREELRLRGETLPPIPTPEGDQVHAAVAVVFRKRSDLDLLMIRRAESEGDPWSGQMALPGGRRDASDPSLLHTAIRETEEETSVSLDREGLPLGRLEAVTPATVRLPPITIFPFAFSVPGDTEARAASREVDEVLWIPLDALRDPTGQGTVEIHYKDNTSREFPCLRVRGRVIWGLTFRILTGLMGILDQGGHGGKPDR